MFIRVLEPDEIPNALKLVWNAFEEHDSHEFDEKLTKSFKAFLTNVPKIPNLKFYATFENGKMISIAAMDNNHLLILFVHKEFRNRGVAKLLWYDIVTFMKNKIFTVDAAPPSIDLYKRLGFSLTGEEKIINDVVLSSMRYVKQL